jgi:hypothetical protein
MQLPKLAARTCIAAKLRCGRVPTVARRDAGTASQLIRGFMVNKRKEKKRAN